MSNIYEKLQSARIELQSKKLKKSGKNSYTGFEYFELADFIPRVNEIFNKLKLCSNFSILDGTATLKIIDWENNQTESFTSPIAELELKSCNKVQALGGTHTYLRRYLYLNALEIVEHDLFDSTAGKKADNPPKISPKDLDIIQGLQAVDTKENAEKYYKTYKDSVINLDNFKKEYAKVYTDRKKKEAKNDV